MRKIIPLLFITVSLFMSCDPTFHMGRRLSEPEREVFVIHGLGESIGYYDIDEDTYYHTDSQGSPFLVGSSPNQLIIDKANNLLYSINSTSNSITYLNLSTLEWVDEVYLGENINPWNMALKGDNSSISYMSGWVSNEILIYNLLSKKIVDRVSLTSYGSQPEGIVVHNGYLYTSYISRNNNGSFGNGGVVVHEIVNDSLRFVEDVKTGVGSNPQSLFVNSETDTLHVICTGVNDEDLDLSNDGKVEIYDIENNGKLTLNTTLSIGGSPLFSPSAIDEANDIVYLSNTGGYITSYNKNTPLVLKNATNPLYKDSETTLIGAIAFVDNTLIASAFTIDQLLFLNTDGTEIKRIPTGDAPQFLILKEK